MKFFPPPLIQKSLSTLREYAFLDRARVDQFVDQLGGMPPKHKKQIRKFGGSLVGPSGEIQIEEIPGSGGYSDKAAFLLKSLWKSGHLSLVRPPKGTQPFQLKRQFYFEEFYATPIIFPKSSLHSDLGLNGLRIWVSDPKVKGNTQDIWNFDGSFLYLTELIFDKDGQGVFWSGCSALKFIINSISGENPIDRNGPEIFGRDNNKHPILKLAGLNVQIGDERKIQSLYTIRYMSNEQCYIDGDRERRAHDIVGYPLFINFA